MDPKPLTSEDYPTTAEMIATGHTFENGQWTSPAIKAMLAAMEASRATVNAARDAEMGDPDAVWF